MDLDVQVDQRHATECRRRAPAGPVQLRVPFDRPLNFCDETPVGPLELEIETTDAAGNFAEWLDDEWWTYAIEHWGDDPITVLIAPTPSALLHPILWHQVEMIRRVVPLWRAIGHGYNDEIVGDEDILAVAASPYHEVRFIDEPRPGRPAAERPDGVKPLPVLFNRIRAAQRELRASTPILVRMPPTTRPTTLQPARSGGMAKRSAAMPAR